MALTEEQMTGSARYVGGPWRYERIDGAGHWMQLERPDELNALLLDFLGGASTEVSNHCRRAGSSERAIRRRLANADPRDRRLLLM